MNISFLLNKATRLTAALSCLVLASCAHVGTERISKFWPALAKAADSKTIMDNASYHWYESDIRMIAVFNASSDQPIIYRINLGARAPTFEQHTHIECDAVGNAVLCTDLGGTNKHSIPLEGGDVFKSLALHARSQAMKLSTFTANNLKSQVAIKQPEPSFDPRRQVHAFELGGQNETVVNAQAFLEAISAQGIPFRSFYPKAPEIGSVDNTWENMSDMVWIRRLGYCTSLATSERRVAVHQTFHSRFSTNIKFNDTYRWEQPIDWRTIGGVKFSEETDVFFYGWYNGSYSGVPIKYLSGVSAAPTSTNTKPLDPKNYSVKEWNLRLRFSNDASLRHRVMYAVTFLQIMCKKNPTP